MGLSYFSGMEHPSSRSGAGRSVGDYYRQRRYGYYRHEKKYTKLNIGGALFLVDLGIVIASCFVFDAQTGLVSLPADFWRSRSLWTMSLKVSTCASILRSSAMIRSQSVILSRNELHRSATIYKAEGAYEHNQKTIIITIMKRSQAVELNYIRIHQPTAFIAITNSSEIIGKGFRELIVKGERFL